MDVIKQWMQPNCQLCGLYRAEEFGLCAPCHADLPWLLFACPYCGLAKTSPQNSCIECQHQTHYFDYTWAPFHYALPLHSIVPNIKYQGQFHALPWLGQLMAHFIRERVDKLPDVIMPVPMYRYHEALRGYNQAGLLARQLVNHLPCALNEYSLIKSRATERQRMLNAVQRRQNLQGAFKVQGDIPDHIAVVDDIMTTGSTLNEIAYTLKLSGAKRVDVWVLARTPADR